MWRPNKLRCILLYDVTDAITENKDAVRTKNNKGAKMGMNEMKTSSVQSMIVNKIGCWYIQLQLLN